MVVCRKRKIARRSVLGMLVRGACAEGSARRRRGTFLNVFMPADTSYAEKHYRVGDLARMWSLGRETVRLLVKDDPGVLKVRMGRKKAHTVYSIPESPASRIHTRLLNGG